MEQFGELVKDFVVWELALLGALLAWALKQIWSYADRIGAVEDLVLDRPGSKVPRLIVGVSKDIDYLQRDLESRSSEGRQQLADLQAKMEELRNDNQKQHAEVAREMKTLSASINQLVGKLDK